MMSVVNPLISNLVVFVVVFQYVPLSNFISRTWMPGVNISVKFLFGMIYNPSCTPSLTKYPHSKYSSVSFIPLPVSLSFKPILNSLPSIRMYTRPFSVFVALVVILM